MDFINQSAFLKALGWSLLDSLWQMGLMWLVYVCLTANGKKFRSHQRHTIALLSLAGGTIWFLGTLILNFYAAVTGPAVVTVLAGSREFLEAGPGGLAQVANMLDPALPFLSVTYLIVAAFLFLRFYLHYRRIGQLYTKQISKVPVEWRIYLQQALEHLGIKKKVSIWFSSLVDTPLTLGFWKPVILLPVAAVNHLSLQQAEAIILHELNHIRRNDYLVNLLIAAADIILFFNPFARMLTGYVRQERENSCDDLVLQFRYDAAAYAHALLTLEQHRGAALTPLAVAATGKNQRFLLNRVKRIVSGEQVTSPISQRLVAYLLSALLIGFIALYNPGKVIVQTIEPELPLVSTELPQPIITPAVESEAEEDNVKSENETVANDTSNEDATAVPEEAVALEDVDSQLQEIQLLIELQTEARLAAAAEQIQKMESEIAGFANAWRAIEFSLPHSTPAAKAQANVNTWHPFVPNNSFQYQVLEDTTLPKKYIMTETEKAAKEAIEKALLALQALDWKNLEQQLQVEGVNMSQLQQQIEKAVRDIDWKKIAAAQEAALERAWLEKMQEQFSAQISNFQRERALQQEKLKQVQQQILLDRLEQHQLLKKLEAEKAAQQNHPTSNPAAKKKKKIIHL